MAAAYLPANLTLAKGWSTACYTLLTGAANLSSGLVDGSGRPVSSYGNETWGIDYATCQQHCNATVIPLEFNFQTFAAGFTNYLLPWLALTAQLPYETGSPWSNMMSFCLAVGSPALITYSLTITILNRYWVRQRFRELALRSVRSKVPARHGDYTKCVNAAQYLLSEAQQVPLRASQEKGWLSSLAVIPENIEWWSRLHARLRSTRRGVTFSLVAQILSAAIAWLFTVIASFLASLGDTAVALQISAGSIWVWLIPVIIGWITVGTQGGPDTISYALAADEAHRAREPPIQDNRFLERGVQRGIEVRSGLSRLLHRNQTGQGVFEASPLPNLDVPKWLGADIRGDERRRGPVYNYARIFTWWQMARSVEGAIDSTLQQIENGVAVSSVNQDRSRTWNDKERAIVNLEGDSFGIASYCDLTIDNSILAYPGWNEISSGVWVQMCVAAGVAMFVQWGTTGASTLIAYLTPTRGLGCRSGGYLFYGSFGTIVWLLLLSSMLLSHACMKRYQAIHLNNPSMDFRQQGPERAWSHSALCGAAVTTRCLGKLIAVCNAIWLIVSSLFEYIGAYDNCWCKADVLGLRHNGWVVLFKDPGDLADAARTPWAGGVAISIIVCSMSYLFFWLGSTKARAS